MSNKKGDTRFAGRDAGNGRFITVEQARYRKNTAVVERLPKPGKGRK